MKFSLYVALIACSCFFSCKLMHPDRSVPDNKHLARVLDAYYHDRMRYLPLEATENGDTSYNDQLPADFTDSYMDSLRGFYSSYLGKILVFDREKLNANDRISYDIFLREMKINLEGLDQHLSINTVLMPNLQYTPFNQFEGTP